MKICLIFPLACPQTIYCNCSYKIAESMMGMNSYEIVIVIVIT